jgi:hypothetical protein
VKISAVFAFGNYCYALDTSAESKSNQLYSWGINDNYVLGNRNEDNEYTPYKGDPKMYAFMPVLSMGCGT